MTGSISSLMHRRVWTVDLDDTVARVGDLLAQHELTWAPVLESGRVIIGVISANDLLQFHKQGGDPLKTRAWQLCTYKPICVDEGALLTEVARAMVERHIHHVVVTSGDARIAGVVSSLDFVRLFLGNGAP
jgi:predicted transcriptional regulator